MDGPVLPRAATRNSHARCLRRSRSLRVPRARGAIRKLEATYGDCSDRADVPARIRKRPAGARVADRYPGANRFRRTCRTGGQKRDPDCRIRAPEGRRWLIRRGGRCACGTYTPPPDLDDVLRVHPGGCPAGGCDGSRRRNAQVSGHGRVVRDVGRDRLRSSVHARLLHFRPQFRP